MFKLYSFVYPILWVFMRIFHPWSSEGRENLPEGGYLLCCNHSSMGDPIYVLATYDWRTQVRVLAKEELMRIPVLGFLLKKAGVIGIRRGEADVSAIKECLRVLKGKGRLLIFPEGTRVKEGEQVQAHSGAAMLAIRSGVPIVPVYVATKKRWFRKTRVVFGKPFDPVYEGKRATSEDYERISAEIMYRIHALEGVQA